MAGQFQLRWLFLPRSGLVQHGVRRQRGGGVRLETNRDLYRAVCELRKKCETNVPDLRLYLERVLISSCELSKKNELNLPELFELLESGFHETGDMPEGWENACAEHFEAWVDSVSFQIIDLQKMAESGALQDPQRYFGLPGPRGIYWNNFGPLTFLECGVAGFFDGWAPGEDSGRRLFKGLAGC